MQADTLGRWALAAWLGLLPACSKNEQAAAPADAGPADAAAEASAASDDVEPVYPLDDAPPSPLAEKLCAALHAVPEERRAECCQAAPGVVMTGECTRTLSAALRAGAVALAEESVERCASAYRERLAGCDWVGPFAPGPPPACLGLVQGKVVAGGSCRSSLECAGDLRCLGVGPTTPGRCGAPKADGQPCGGTVDTLATYTRQANVDARHPECKDRCIRHKCAPALAEGEACRTSGECAGGLTCAPAARGKGKTCVARPPAAEGEACAGDGCAEGLSCIRGKCARRKPAGEACEADFECLGGCAARDGSAKRTCGPRCDVR